VRHRHSRVAGKSFDLELDILEDEPVRRRSLDSLEEMKRALEFIELPVQQTEPEFDVLCGPLVRSEWEYGIASEREKI
jgi:hypothetical protein